MVQGRFEAGASYGGGTFAPPTTEGVLSRRFFAYLVDIVMILGLILILSFAITLLGLVTFGLGWALYAFVVPGAAILYSAATVGGPSQATVGMRMTGVYAADSATGGHVSVLNAAIHALLFYLAAGTLLLVIDVLIGLGRSDRRLGHDLLTGIVFLRRP